MPGRIEQAENAIYKTVNGLNANMLLPGRLCLHNSALLTGRLFTFHVSCFDGTRHWVIVLLVLVMMVL